MESALIFRLRLLGVTLRLVAVLALASVAIDLSAEQVRVVKRQGNEHGFLLLKDANGTEIASGEEICEARGSVISLRTIFRFRDGSVDDEETALRQASTFQLIRDHHIQKGPSFPKPIDVMMDVTQGKVSWTDLSKKNGQPKTQHMNLPADLANGILPLLGENFPNTAAALTVSYLAVDAEPRVVKLTIKPDGSDKVLIGPYGRQAERFNIHTEIGGLTGVVATLVGKQPPDIKMWIIRGAVPVFIRLDAPLFEQGPIWSILLAAPTWPTGKSKSDGD